VSAVVARLANGAPAAGLSSGSAPEAGPDALAGLTQDGGGSVVDLRLGKGHLWERDGAAAGVAAIERACVGVAFVGVGWTLGASPIRPPRLLAGRPTKVFVTTRPDKGVVIEQLALADEAGCPLWVETHRGGPTPSELAELAEQTGVGIVVDLLGLRETAPGCTLATLAALAPHVRAVQVKGIAPSLDGYVHRSLQSEDLATVHTLLELAAPIVAVTVESRAGTPVSDLKVLNNSLGNAVVD
jgi:hypothetical protein